MISEHRPVTRLGLAAALALVALSACGKAKRDALADGDRVDAALAPETWAGFSAGFVDSSGAPSGQAVIVDAPQGVLFRLRVEGLSAGWHGLHFHAVGDCSDGPAGFKAAGPHLNPENAEHGLLNPAGSERGNLPNLYVNADGRATAEIFRGGVNLQPSERGAAERGPFPLFDDDGFAIVIHANEDDHATHPTGGSGDRVLCAAFKG